MDNQQPLYPSFPFVRPIKQELIAAASEQQLPGPSTSSMALQTVTDLRIRNSLNTVLDEPSDEDVRVNSEIRPPKSEAQTNVWCMVYYFEMNERVGEVFKSELKPGQSENPLLIIDGGVCTSAENTRFCLGVIGNINRNPVVTKVGRSIGKGLRLQQRDENIYLDCLSDSALFVQCPLFARKSNDELATVYKLKKGDGSASSSSGESICLFDMKLFESLLAEAKVHGYNALYMLQIYCLCRISFVKGWGQQYRRQTITACPMWIEVQFPRPLQMLDDILMEYADEIGGEEVHSFS